MREIIFIVAIAGLAIFYMNSVYGTARPCDAFKLALVEESPGILEEMAKRDSDFQIVSLGQRLFDPTGASIREFSRLLVNEIATDANVIACSFMVGMREVAPAQFRTRVAAELLDQES